MRVGKLSVSGGVRVHANDSGVQINIGEAVIVAQKDGSVVHNGKPISSGARANIEVHGLHLQIEGGSLYVNGSLVPEEGLPPTPLKLSWWERFINLFRR